jgi:SAM-dependent methyltransferase
VEHTAALQQRYRDRGARGRLRRALEPPAPFIMNPREPVDFPLGRWNLYIGGAGRSVPGYLNLDLFPMRGVDIAADAEQLPFADGVFQRVECDAVLEHVRDPVRVCGELRRVLAPGGYLHLVTPFCHPFHEYPKDYRRFTLDGLKLLAGDLEIVAEGWRTGPTATLLVVGIEWVKGLLPWRWWRGGVHFALGWLLFPLRYLDLPLLGTARAGRIGNHCYLWLRKPGGVA